MSNLRELLNPESPSKCTERPTTNESASSVVPMLVPMFAPRRSSSPLQTYSRNPLYINDPLYQLDNPYNAHSSVAKTAEDSGHSHLHHENCPDSLDCLPDTDDRPQHTLPIILRCAILGSAKKRLTIRDIYAAMENKYPYYKTAGPAWKQSVRHHLSLSKLFERKAKPVTEPGFGSYWTVNLNAPPGTKRPRKRGRYNKNASADKNGGSTNTELSNTADQGSNPRRNGQPEFESTLGASPPNATHFPSSNGYPSLHLQTTEYPAQQFRLHSVNTLPSPGFDRDDDDLDAQDAQDQYGDENSPVYSDDAEESVDENAGAHATYSYPNDPRSLPPPSFSSVPAVSRFGIVTGYNDSNNEIERLHKENEDLRRQMLLFSAAKLRMENELDEAHAEIARLRARTEAVERGTCGHVPGVHD